jgi:hypothetical protein
MTYRIVHWGTGNVGKLGLAAVLDRADCELVGHYVFNPEKEGCDSGELIGRAPVGIRTSRDLDALIAMRPDAVTYFGNSMLDPLAAARDMARFLEAGINVVTTCLSQLLTPATMSPELRDIIDPACRKGMSSLFFAGMDPGFATTQMPIGLYGIANRIDQIRLQEFADWGTWIDTNDTNRTYFGFGLPPEAETPMPKGELLRRVWVPTLEENARALGWTIDEMRTSWRAATAPRDYEVAMGRVDKGTVAALWFQLIAVVGGEEKLVLEHINWIAQEALPADWPTPPRYRGAVSHVSYRTVIEGDPAFDVELQVRSDDDGLHVTALQAVNAIPMVVAASPGVISQGRIAPFGPTPRRN